MLQCCTINCSCLAATDNVEHIRNEDGSIPLHDFAALRARCLALRDVLLPDDIWPEFQKWHVAGDDVAAHCSIALLAFCRGILPSVTAPIHRYLMSNEGILPLVAKQYLRDLRERWMFDPNAIERNRLSRIFRGRLIELQFALWLEAQSHTIIGLEATRKGPDIETESANGIRNAFELKFIGMVDDDFDRIVKTMAGLRAGGAVSVYQPVNYLLFRTYEAANQLASSPMRKNVVIVIDEIAWTSRFDLQVRNRWINWDSPQFIEPDDGFNSFLGSQRGGAPSETALYDAISAINRIMIFRQDYAFQFRLELDVNIG
jgi:hypothetical protein